MDGSHSIIGQRCAKLKEIQAKVSIIARKFNPEKIIFFGSYINGTPTTESDVDLLVIMQTDKSKLEISSQIALTLNHTFPMDILVKTPEQIAKRIKEGDFFLEDIMNQGKIIYEKAHS